MDRLSFHLLGGFYARQGGEPTPHLRTRKARALLVYLLTEAVLTKARTPHSRDNLMGLLWPERGRKSARRNLRQVLYQVRQALPEVPGREVGKPVPLIVSDRDTVGLNPDAAYTLDVELFLTHLACKDTGDCGPLPCPSCLEALEEGVSLYEGDFLQGVSLPHSQPFEEWALLTREFLRRQALEALDTLAEAYLRSAEWEAAVRAARAQLHIDELREGAARQLMSGLARLSRRAEALQAYEEFRARLREELDVEPSEATRRLYKEILSRRLEGVTPRRGDKLTFHLSSLSHNLPHRPPPFIGREEEMATVSERLRNPNCRLLTLVGPGGAGKTRLAVEAAAAYHRDPQNMGGVYCTSLAGLDRAEQLPFAIGAALGLTFSGQQAVRDELLLNLQPQRLLLLLDSYEGLLPHTALVRDLLERCPDVQLLVTSRQRLRLQWEWLVEVQGLSTQARDGAEPPALALFRHHVRRLNLHPEESPEAEELALEICRAVEGLPLGLELAAVQLREFSLEQVAERLTGGLGEVARQEVDVPERHQSLRASLDYSWELLAPEDRALLARLSFFRGGFTEEAAREVTGAEKGQLRWLRDSSLLWKRHGDCYTMHQLVQQYAGEKLAERPQARQETAARHAAFYADFAERLFRERAGSYDLVWDFEPEMGNLRQAWQYGVAHPTSAMLAQMTPALQSFYELRGWHEEAREVFDQALEAMRTLAVLEMGRQQQRTLGILLWARAWMGHQTEVKECHRMADEAVALLRPLEDRRNLGIAFEVRGSLAVSPGIGQVEEGIADLRMALTFLDPGAPYVVAAVQGLLGLVHERIHERKTAERWWQCCREQAASLNFSRMYALASIHLADLARRRREYEKATELIEAAMANSHGGADKIVYGDAKKVAGQLALDQGGYAAARDHLLEAYEIPAFAERWTYRLELEGLLGRAYLGLGERQAAAKHLANALEQAQRLELPEAALATLLVVAQWAAGSDAGGALALLDLVRAHAAAPRPLREAAEAQFDALAENASPSLRREALAEAKGAQLWESVAAWRERLER